jgi:hypothetical protein
MNVAVPRWIVFRAALSWEMNSERKCGQKWLD